MEDSCPGFFYLVDEVAKRAQMEIMVMKELDHSDE